MRDASGRQLGTDNRDIIVIGGSAGAIDVLRGLLAGLPPDLPAAIFVVIHRTAQEPNLLADLLNAAGSLLAAIAVDGQPFEHGRVYVPPSDRHLLIGRDHMHVRRSPRENRTRPAIDPLFRSAAVHCSTRVIGVVLSGMLNDGTAGLLAVKRCSGLAIVQEPDDASCPSMPASALRHIVLSARDRQPGNGAAQRRPSFR